MEGVWKRRQPVWACEHMWQEADRGNQKVRTAIKDAAEDFLTDSGENVVLCAECSLHDQAVLMARRWVNSEFGDVGGTYTLIDVALTRDGPPMAAYPWPGQEKELEDGPDLEGDVFAPGALAFVEGSFPVFWRHDATMEDVGMLALLPSGAMTVGLKARALEGLKTGKLSLVSYARTSDGRVMPLADALREDPEARLESYQVEPTPMPGSRESFERRMNGD